MKGIYFAIFLVGLSGCGGSQAGAKGGDGQQAAIVHHGDETKGEAHDDEHDVHDAPHPAGSAAPAASAAAALPPGLIPLSPLLPVPDPSPPGGFPTARGNDKDCTRAVGLTGKLDRDMASLLDACGTGAGMKEYAKVSTGKLGPGHVRDTYAVKLAGGYCYRFFAMAGGSIEKLNLRVERPNGALHSAVQGKQPVVLYKPGETWCRRRDRDFHLVVEAPGGEGDYSFAIFARPNEKGRAK